jgi:hypothetical protein
MNENGYGTELRGASVSGLMERMREREFNDALKFVGDYVSKSPRPCTKDLVSRDAA